MLWGRYQEEHLHQRCDKDARKKGKKRVSAENSDDKDISGPSHNVKKGKARHVLNSSDLDSSD